MKSFEELWPYQVCVCGHGIGWHALSWLHAKKGKPNLGGHCEAPHDYQPCTCAEFELDANIVFQL